MYNYPKNPLQNKTMIYIIIILLGTLMDEEVKHRNNGWSI